MEIRVRDRLLDGHAAGKDLATYGVLRQREEPPGLEVVLRVIAVVRALHKTIALGDVLPDEALGRAERPSSLLRDLGEHVFEHLSLIHISEPTRLGMISYAVFCLKKKK